MNKNLYPKLSFIAVIALVLITFGVTKAVESADDPYEAILYAGKPKPGQENPVGGVQVWNDAETLYVRFEVDEPWCILQTHLQVANDLSGIPQTKTKKTQDGGNPVPGLFAYNDDHDCVSFVDYQYDLDDLIDETWEAGDQLVIAAHAVVTEVECELLAEAPYEAFAITEVDQGLKKDGTEVLEVRSDPTAVLTLDTNQLETDFFSLGFGGSIVVEFECCIVNGEGDDLLVVEDTWGEYYPLESADLYASMDGVNWVYLGVANNVVRDPVYTWQTVSSFDLGELELAQFIKVVDTTDPAPLEDTADGYDLNTIQALQDCYYCTYGETETAWAGEEEFDGSNWARYFRYELLPLWITMK